MAVGVELQSFLMSHPYKNKLCLEHLCDMLKIPRFGKNTAETLRSKITDYAGDDKSREEHIKDLATKFQTQKLKVRLKSRSESPTPPTMALSSDLEESPPQLNPEQLQNKHALDTLSAPSTPIATAILPVNQSTPADRHKTPVEEDQPPASNPQTANPSEPVALSEANVHPPPEAGAATATTGKTQTAVAETGEESEEHISQSLFGDESTIDLNAEFQGVKAARERFKKHLFIEFENSMAYDNEFDGPYDKVQENEGDDDDGGSDEGDDNESVNEDNDVTIGARAKSPSKEGNDDNCIVHSAEKHGGNNEETVGPLTRTSGKQMTHFLDKVIDITASKESQIEWLESQLCHVIEVTGKMMEKTDANMKDILTISGTTQQCVTDLLQESKHNIEEAAKAKEKELEKALEMEKWKNELEERTSSKMEMMESQIAQILSASQTANQMMADIVKSNKDRSEQEAKAKEELGQAREQVKKLEQEVQLQSQKIAQLEEQLETSNDALKAAQAQSDIDKQQIEHQNATVVLLEETAQSLNKDSEQQKEHPENQGQSSGENNISINTRLQNIASEAPLPSGMPPPPKDAAISAPREALLPTPTHPMVRPKNQTSSSEANKADEAQEAIIVVVDSNGQHINPGLLHNTKKVFIEERSTWEAVRDHLPNIPYPQKITDVVFLTGINNVISMEQQLQNILDTADQAGKNWGKRYPQATFHLSSIAPVDGQCMNYNFHLQDLADNRKVSFITIENMFDENNGRLKPNVLERNQLTKYGTSLLATQIKRSLYKKKTVTGSHNHQSKGVRTPSLQHRPTWPVRPVQQFQFQQSEPKQHCQPWPSMHRLPNQPTWAQRVQAVPQWHNQGGLPKRNTAMILETFFNIAKACLPQD